MIAKSRYLSFAYKTASGQAVYAADVCIGQFGLGQGGYRVQPCVLMID